MSLSKIAIKGARVHNLKNISLDLPKNALICFTGVSGSGKSSLAFDTIYAEGQRRYVESLSAYARQFLGHMQKPDVDLISGLAPAISIEQKATGQNPRSTVGTITELYDFMRVLFARVGTPHCVKCANPIGAQTREQIVTRILALPEDARLHTMAPVIQGRRGEYRDLFEDLLREGYLRARIDGDVVNLSDAPDLDRNMRHYIEVVTDRLIIRDGIRTRLLEAVESALILGNGAMVVNVQAARERCLRPPVQFQLRLRRLRHQLRRAESTAFLIQQPSRHVSDLPRPGYHVTHGTAPGGAGPFAFH